METTNGYTFRTDLPGIDRKDVDVHVDGNLLTVSATRERCRNEEEQGMYSFTERSYGKFSRTLSLPEGVDESSLRAVLENGVLTLTVNRAVEDTSRRRRISVE